MSSVYEIAPVGKRFNRLTVARAEAERLRLRGPEGTWTKWLWLFRCSCGTEKLIEPRRVISGRIRSCGCLQRERANGYEPKHGMYKTAEYRAWQSMKTRCFNPKSSTWSGYGGRGITVFPGWIDSFEAFFAYVGPKPTPKHSLGRIDNDGNYEPGNVEWQTQSQQSSNQRPRTKARRLYPPEPKKAGRKPADKEPTAELKKARGGFFWRGRWRWP